MNFRGGCCIAKYGGGGGGGGYDMSKVDRIMLRYRPIAPRPDSGGSSSPPEKNVSVNVSSKSRRGKRKYSKENSSSSGGSDNSNGNTKRCNRRRSEEVKNGSGGGEIVTLPLLKETPEKKESPSLTKVFSAAPSLWLSFGDNGLCKTANKNLDLPSELTTETVVSSLLTVECLAERWDEGEYELGYTDEEKKMNLEKDTCPGFISDGLGRVIWTNGSYKKLVLGKDEQCSKMSVWLVMKDRLLLTQRTFTCRMRLQYTCRDKEVSSITSFCDVWRMNDGGFAWRLDVNAALCLGR